MSSLTALSTDGVQIVPELSGDVLRLRASGMVAMRDPGQVLNPFFAELDAEAERAGTRTVEMDLRGLTFMNSSGIATLVRWVMRQGSRPEATGYRLVLRYDARISWQRINVPMLETIAPSVVAARSD